MLIEIEKEDKIKIETVFEKLKKKYEEKAKKEITTLNILENKTNENLGFQPKEKESSKIKTGINFGELIKIEDYIEDSRKKLFEEEEEV